MSFFKDTFAIFKKNELVFLDKYKESDDVYTFLFEKEKALTWNAGQHGLFTITHKKIKNATRPFSLASAPTEDVIKITTGISDNPSDFKKALLELEKGMKITMRGPVGSFYIKDNNPSLFIAGGIGITPFRAMIKQLEAEGNGAGKQVKLLYIDSKKSYIYKDELDNAPIDITYLESREELYQEIDTFSATHKNNATYFVAGPNAMVSSITDHLKSKHISKGKIKKDAFWGIK